MGEEYSHAKRVYVSGRSPVLDVLDLRWRLSFDLRRSMGCTFSVYLFFYSIHSSDVIRRPNRIVWSVMG